MSGVMFVCPPPRETLPLDARLGVGFGIVTVRRDDEAVWTGDNWQKKAPVGRETGPPRTGAALGRRVLRADDWHHLRASGSRYVGPHRSKRGLRVSDLLYLAADTLPVWRPAAIFVLVGVVVVLLHLASAE